MSTENRKLTQAEHDEAAFLEYVQNMHRSVGQLFVVQLIQDNGYEAFEAFWHKLKDARYGDAAQMELNRAEERALAKALQGINRRDFLRVTAALGLFTGAAIAGRSGMEDLRLGARRYRGMDSGEAIGVVLKLTGAVVGGVVGLGLLLNDRGEPTPERAAQLARGPEGEKNVAQLVHTLDALFKPIEISLDETGVRRSL